MRLSSQEFIVVRSIGVCSGKTACTVANMGPLNVLEATVVRMVGTLKTFAALAKPVTLLMSNCVSMDCAAKAICGWWSMSTRTAFCGVRSRGLAPAFLLVGVWAETPVVTTSMTIPIRALQTAFMVVSLLYAGD